MLIVVSQRPDRLGWLIELAEEKRLESCPYQSSRALDRVAVLMRPRMSLCRIREEH